MELGPRTHLNFLLSQETQGTLAGTVGRLWGAQDWSGSYQSLVF